MVAALQGFFEDREGEVFVFDEAGEGLWVYLEPDELPVAFDDGGCCNPL